MTSIVTNNIRVVSANQFINAFQSTKYDAWRTGEAYSIGDIVLNSFFKYIAVSSGTSGASAPSHTSGQVSDGGVTWMFVENFVQTANFENNMYIAISKTTPWDNPSAGDETPIDPTDSNNVKSQLLRDLISTKRLEASNVKLAIARHDWDTSGGTVYSEYNPDTAIDAYSTPFYVIADNNVYKCLNNNNGAQSITKPTGTNADAFQTAGDGYQWKYMFSVNASDALQFLSPSYIPVEVKTNNDGSAQWNVQQNAKSGSISTIKVTDGGSGYSTATVTIDAPTNGTQATATPVIEGGVITSIQLTVIGENYDSIPSVSISGNGTGATANAIMAPKDGHGANALIELGARYVIVSARFSDAENGYFPVSGENDFRQISIIADPLDSDGNPAEGARYIGPAHEDYDDGGDPKAKIQAGSGHVMYIESVAPVVRAPGQIEDLQIILKF